MCAGGGSPRGGAGGASPGKGSLGDGVLEQNEGGGGEVGVIMGGDSEDWGFP